MNTITRYFDTECIFFKYYYRFVVTSDKYMLCLDIPLTKTLGSVSDLQL